MTTRFNTVETLVDADVIDEAFTEQLATSVNYLTVPGAAIAALDTSISANTLTIAAGCHQVTVATGDVDSINDASGPSEGQVVELIFTNAQLIRNNGGGTGNIRTRGGADRYAEPGAVVKFLYDGTYWWHVPSGPPLLAKSGTLIDIVSSTTETDLIGTQGSGLSIPAGTLGTAGKIRVECECDFIGNSTSQGLRVRLYYGATTLFDSGMMSANLTSAARMPLALLATLSALGATNSQHGRVTALPAPTGTATTGEGAITSGAFSTLFNLGGASSSPATEDSTAAKNLRLTVTLSSSSSGLEFRCRHSIVEVKI